MNNSSSKAAKKLNVPFFASLPPRTLYFAALALIWCAIVAQLLAQGYAAHAVMTIARSVAAPAQRPQMQTVANSAMRRYELWQFVSFALALPAFCFWRLSCRRGERGSRMLIFALFAFYVLMLLLII